MAQRSFKTLVGATRTSADAGSAALLSTGILNGRTYLIAPVVPVCEGSHNGEFLSYEELSVFPEMWLGSVLPIDHPQTADGEPASANSPAIMESSVIGMLFNVIAREDIRGISGELWIDIEKAATVPGGSRVLEILQAGEQLEVSTAYYCFVDNIPGEWMNPRTGKPEKYTSSQTQVRPDHLALLPYDTGACSWQDGCGAPRINKTDETRINKSENNSAEIDHTVNSTNMQVRNSGDIKLQFKQIQNGDQMENALNSAIAAHVGTGETSTAIINRLAAACGIDGTRMKSLVAGELDFVPKHWLEIIAAVLDIDPWDLFMASSNDNMDARYGIKDIEVANNSEKKIAAADASLTIPQNGIEKPLEEEKPCMKGMKAKILEILQSLGITKGADIKEEKTEMAMNAETKKTTVDALIASKLNQFSEANREWLTGLSDEQLATLEPVVASTEAVAEPVVAAAAVAANVEVVKPVTLTKAEILATIGIDEATLASIQNVAGEKKAARAAKIAEIKANAQNPYTDTELAAFSDATLEKTHAMLNPESPFRITPGRFNQNDATDTVPEPPAILLAKPGVKGVDYAVQTARNLSKGIN